MKFLTLGIIPLVVLHISSISATKPGQNVKMMALTMMGLREALCWKVVRVFWHCLNSFWPSLCKTGTMLHFFGPYFFLSDGRHNIRNWNIRSAFFQQWVYASNIQFWVTERVSLFARFLTLHESKMCRGLQSAWCVYLLKGSAQNIFDLPDMESSRTFVVTILWQ